MIVEAQASRRLPVYILADRSGSMMGEPIVAVNQGLQFLKSDLETEPRAVESVWLSVISFGNEATIDVPLIELMQFSPPMLQANGSTHLGDALRLLGGAIDRDLNPTIGVQAHTGDYKPLVFLFTDGEPTDTWRDAAAALKNRTERKTANIIAVGCGPNVNTGTLKEISEMVMLMEDVNAGSFQRLIAWISQSVKSAGVQQPGGGSGNNPAAPVALPPIPQGFTIVM